GASVAGRESGLGYDVAAGRYRAIDYAVEPDASAAAYFFAAAAICGGRVTVPGLGRRSHQGDLGLVGLLARMGATVAHTDHAPPPATAQPPDRPGPTPPPLWRSRPPSPPRRRASRASASPGPRKATGWGASSRSCAASGSTPRRKPTASWCGPGPSGRVGWRP